MKRVLIITYYWPPSGGSGVQRWLKMSKYLPENGWQPVIYTAEDAEYPVEDQSLMDDVAPEAEVIRRPIVEPYSFYKKFLGIKKGEKVKAGFINEGAKKTGWKESLSVWLRGNLFIPDARCWWIKPSVRYLKKYLKEHPVDAIISTGPPHSMHLIAKALHKELNIPWVADFRDPWTDIDYYKDLKLTRRSDCKHHRFENQVLTEATKVVTVGWDCSKGLENHGAKDVAVITNGYDDLPSVRTRRATSQSDMMEFTMSHIGIIGANRNPETFWAAISELDIPIKIRLIGQIDNSIIESIKRNNIEKYVEIIPYIPHNQVIEEQQKSDVLLLFVNNTPNAKGILTGKIFEYMASGRPILCIGPEDGDSARILNETQTGVTVDFNDKEKMKAIILEYFNKSKENQCVTTDGSKVEKYSRKNLTKEYAQLLNQII
ncbi:MAG: glycosyltransferase family 4 protein [Bacteroidales bacterium]|nr:glycosyltransferase family 4 protein [Bacteroidales bacterium]